MVKIFQLIIKDLPTQKKLLVIGILMDVKLQNVGGLLKNFWKSGENHRFSFLLIDLILKLL
jgi:hypothetical protein